MIVERIEMSSSTCSHIVISDVDGVTFADLKQHLVNEYGGEWVRDDVSVIDNWYMIDFIRTDIEIHPVFKPTMVFRVESRMEALSSPAFMACIQVNMPLTHIGDYHDEPEEVEASIIEDTAEVDFADIDPDEIEESFWDEDENCPLVVPIEDRSFSDILREALGNPPDRKEKTSNIASFPWQKDAAPRDDLDRMLEESLGIA